MCVGVDGWKDRERERERKGRENLEGLYSYYLQLFRFQLSPSL